MKMSLWMAVVATCAVTYGRSQQPTPSELTFEQALEMTMTRNPSLKAAEYEHDAAVRERKAVYGLRLPQVGVTGAYMYMADDIAIDMNNLKQPVSNIVGGLPSGLLPPALLQEAAALLSKDWSLTLQDRSVGTVAANVTVPLYTGGKINAANNAAKIKIEQVGQKGDQTRNALVSELTERYYGLALANQLVEVRKQVLDGMQHHLDDAIALEQNGIIAKGERLYAEVHRAEAEREYQKAQTTVETLTSALNATLDTEGSAYHPISEMFILSKIDDVNVFKEQAKTHNPLLQQVGSIRRLAGENLRLQRADFAPQVALMGSAALYNYQVTRMLPKWAVGAGVSFKIFDGLSREYKFSAARYQIKQAEAAESQAGTAILTLIDKLYNDMTTYAQQMPSIEASYRFAVEYLRVKEVAFKEGAAPSSDVVDAQLNLAKIRIERLQAAYYYDLMLARLLEASGVSDTFASYATRTDAEPIRFE